MDKAGPSCLLGSGCNLRDGIRALEYSYTKSVSIIAPNQDRLCPVLLNFERFLAGVCLSLRVLEVDR
jgi:hypothetical protein